MCVYEGCDKHNYIYTSGVCVCMEAVIYIIIYILYTSGVCMKAVIYIIIYILYTSGVCMCMEAVIYIIIYIYFWCVYGGCDIHNYIYILLVCVCV